MCCTVFKPKNNFFHHHHVAKINVECHGSVSSLTGSSQSELIKGKILFQILTKHSLNNSKLIKYIAVYIWLNKCLAHCHSQITSEVHQNHSNLSLWHHYCNISTINNCNLSHCYWDILLKPEKNKKTQQIGHRWVKLYVTNEKNINHVNCSDPTKAEAIHVLSMKSLACINAQQLKLIDDFNLLTHRVDLLFLRALQYLLQWHYGRVHGNVLRMSSPSLWIRLWRGYLNICISLS